MLLQLCYASSRVERQKDLLQDLSDILATARVFNQAKQIYGVLYYAEGMYFQCLEGEREDLESLFLRIAQDDRHHDIHRFADREIEKHRFSKWSMKYVNQHGRISKFFEQLGCDQFSPHQLDSASMDIFLDILFKLEFGHHHAKAKTGLNHRGYQNFF